MTQEKEKKQILIVEDNELNRAMLGEILSEEHRVLEAENGQAALDILKDDKDNIALILLDVMMPVMDGFTFLDRIKEDPELSLIPVIVMTQNDNEEDEVSALAHGATDFVPKPYRPQVILHRIASIINLRENAAMVNLLKYDKLTGLYSKEFFYQKVKEQLQKEPETEYTIVSTNIENFKLYNDNFGVAAGDALLQEMAHLLMQLSGEYAICGRYSADRFLCLKESRQERKDRAVISGDYNYYVKNVVMKWGIYEITDRTLPVEQMCDRALLAVDSIKGQYHQHFAIYDDTLRNKLLREQAITDAMEAALEEGQFVVYFQPKYSLNSESMIGAEALVRWNHPEWGFISPGEFVPLFEKNGFISRMDLFIWEQVCARLREWKEKGYSLLPVSVNVSRADIYQMDLAHTLLELTGKYDVDPAYLHLEITESAYADSPDRIISAANQLRKLGFMIEMDDFGSGYSSLNMLNQMDLDILKLDMAFVRNEMAKPVNRSILNYVISMSHAMDLTVVAEGVETREQLNRLRAIGCDYAQGYFFAKPMPAAEYEELLRSQSDRGEAFVRNTPRSAIKLQYLLVLEEDDSFLESIRSTFEGQYQLLRAADDQSALEDIRSYGIETIFAAVLSMTYPGGCAARLMKALRQDPGYWQIPVLATIPMGTMMDELPLALEADDFLCKCHPQCDLKKRVQRLVGITASRAREITLQDEACRDYLTGLLNRRGFQAAIDSLQKEDFPLAVCLFDLDNLKKINDTYGHEEGDRIIKSFAELLRKSTRGNDITCRYGGDEFIVILKRLKDRAVAVKKCMGICQAFQESCSCGIVLSSSEKMNFTKLIQCADQALYHVKRENKGGCFVWGDDSE